MPTDYAEHSTEELLEELETAGRYPDPALIERCVQQQEEITPGLLDVLQEDVENRDWERWGEDDPRWYRMIHAGLLLIHFREEEALPLFAEEYRDPDDFNEWFTGKLCLYGPPAIPALTDLLDDEAAGVWGRVEAAGELAHIAWAHPETEERVVPELRRQLPLLDEAGAPDEVDEDPMLLWTNVAYELARLGDEESRPQIDALFDDDLLDPIVFGDQDEYHRILRGEGSVWLDFEEASFDVVEEYERRARVKRRAERRRAAREREEQQRRDRAEASGQYEGGTFKRREGKVGRNDPCPCGSGRKYKHCCGKP